MTIHVPAIPLFPLRWKETWTIGAPDRWTATKKLLSGVVVHEVEFSNASFVRGSKGSQAFGASVQVQPPTGYTLVADCDRPLPSVWYPMHACMRRYALYPKNRPDLRPEAEQAARGTYDVTWRTGRTKYGPCEMPLPDLTAQQAAYGAWGVAAWLGQMRDCLEHSRPGGFEDSQDGTFFQRDGWQPWGPKERGAHAGSGIYFYTGWEQAPDSPAYNWLAACANHERWWHAYHRSNGNVVTADDYPDPTPHYQQGTNDPNNGWLPEFYGVAQSPEPIVLPYDAAHSIRGFRHLIACSEMMDSPAVRRMLRSVAAQFRLQLSDRGQTGQWGRSLKKLLGQAKSAPHTGTWGQDTGRQLGWVAYVIAQSVKRAGATENVAWCKMFADFSETAAMPTGIVSRCANSAAAPLDVWFDPDHDLAHAFEVPIFWHGAIGCSIQGGRPIQNATRFATALYEEAPLLPYYSGVGPPNYAWVAKRGGAPYATITGGKGGTGDSSHSAAGCALAAHVTGQRKRFIDAALRIDPNMADMRRVAGLVAQMQRSAP